MEKPKNLSKTDRFKRSFTIDMPFEECHDRLLLFGTEHGNDVTYLHHPLDKDSESTKKTKRIDFALSSAYSLIPTNVVTHRVGTSTRIGIQVNLIMIVFFCLFGLGYSMTLMMSSSPISPRALGIILTLILLGIILYLETIYTINRQLMQLLTNVPQKNKASEKTSICHVINQPLDKIYEKMRTRKVFPIEHGEIHFFVYPAEEHMYQFTAALRAPNNGTFPINYDIKGYLKLNQEDNTTLIYGDSEVGRYWITIIMVLLALNLMFTLVGIPPHESAIFPLVLGSLYFGFIFIKLLYKKRIMNGFVEQLDIIFSEDAHYDQKSS